MAPSALVERSVATDGVVTKPVTEPAVPSVRPRPGSTGSTGDRRMVRLRRTVLLSLAALVLGTMVARGAQDPAVALPRTSEGGQAQVLPDAEPGAAAGAAPGGPQADLPTGQASPAGPAAGNDSPVPSAASAPAAPPAQAPPASPTPTSDSQENSASPGAGSTGELEEGASDPSTPPGQAEPVQQAARGTVHAVELATGPTATAGRPVRYSIEVEDGISVSENEFAETVQRVLADDRGWATQDGVGFVPVAPGELRAGASVDIRVTLATPSTTARLCAPLNTTISQVSCWNGHRAVLNLQRWVRGATTYADDIAAYRTYLINHEVGHGLGHRHQQCPAPGQPAPIMVQQTKSLGGCTAWPWPTRP